MMDPFGLWSTTVYEIQNLRRSSRGSLNGGGGSNLSLLKVLGFQKMSIVKSMPLKSFRNLFLRYRIYYFHFLTVHSLHSGFSKP